MNKSIKIIDELCLEVLISSRLRGNEPLFRNLDKIPKKLIEKMKEVKSEDLKSMRPDSIFPEIKK